MFSYRHAFHAGNHADVLKHVVLLALVRHLHRKEGGCWLVDTHAGAGWYELSDAAARKNREFEGGIGAFADDDPAGLPEALADYLAQVRAFNGGGPLLRYPGSPALLAATLRAQDRLKLYELHPTEAGILGGRFPHSRRIRVEKADGFAAPRAILPPPSRRALVLIDPSYEDKDDYRRVRRSLAEALERFATGVYAIWYPRVRRRESEGMAAALKQMVGEDWLHASLDVDAPPAGGHGLYGSGMFVVNPPWTLPGSLEPVLPILASRLGRGPGAGWGLEHRIR
jgi:23S rRNA (adenine2030-N6)-methyltransferase